MVENDAVGGLQHWLKTRVLVIRVRVRNAFTAVLTVDEVVHHARLQRAGAEQGHQGDHVFKAVGLELFDQLFHAARFKLEHRGGFRALQHVVGFFVVQRNQVDIDQFRFATALLLAMDGLHRPFDDGQSSQTEEVELHQASGFHVVFIELRH